MISPEIIHVNYIKKEAQTGSYCGMRYRLSKGKNEEGDCMDVTIWPEPFCFVKTPAEQKTTKQFPLTQDFIHDNRMLAERAFYCFYILSGAEKPSTSMQVSSTSLVSFSSAIQPACFF